LNLYAHYWVECPFLYCSSYFFLHITVTSVAMVWITIGSYVNFRSPAGDAILGGSRNISRGDVAKGNRPLRLDPWGCILSLALLSFLSASHQSWGEETPLCYTLLSCWRSGQAQGPSNYTWNPLKLWAQISLSFLKWFLPVFYLQWCEL
jgi:hypothetical protein